MNTGLVIVLVVLLLAAGLLTAYLVRLFRRSREIERTLDYSKMKEWKDDD